MAVVEDYSSPPDYLEEELDGKIDEKMATSAVTQKEVCIKRYFENNKKGLMKKCFGSAFDKALMSL